VELYFYTPIHLHGEDREDFTFYSDNTNSVEYVMHVYNTVHSESRCALRLRYVRVQACIDPRGHHFQHLS
jgi:hypothetical protein